MNITCETATDQLPMLAAGALDGADEDALRAHLDSCAECAAEWRIVQSVRALDVAVPAGLAAQLHSAVAAATRPSGRRFMPHHAIAAAAAIALLGGVLAVQQLRTSPPLLTQVDSTLNTPASPVDGATFPVASDPLVGSQSAVSELTEAQLEALLTEMDS